MSATLQAILSDTRRDLAARTSAARTKELEKRAAEHSPRGFRTTLWERSRFGPAVIAELKKASPSKGLIRADFDVVGLAKELEAAGATALSVLTDAPHFQGSLENLERASQTVKIPCLRKDFMVDPAQVVEARAYGADAILLIVAALSDRDLRNLHDEAKRFGLDALCEVHDRDELKRAADLGFDLIGVNNRNLKTFHVDLANAFRFAEEFPPNALRVAESGIHSREDIDRLRAAGYSAFLIGESLMRAQAPGTALKELIG